MKEKLAAARGEAAPPPVAATQRVVEPVPSPVVAAEAAVVEARELAGALRQAGASGSSFGAGSIRPPTSTAAERAAERRSASMILWVVAGWLALIVAAVVLAAVCVRLVYPGVFTPASNAATNSPPARGRLAIQVAPRISRSSYVRTG